MKSSANVIDRPASSLGEAPKPPRLKLTDLYNTFDLERRRYPRVESPYWVDLSHGPWYRRVKNEAAVVDISAAGLAVDVPANRAPTIGQKASFHFGHQWRRSNLDLPQRTLQGEVVRVEDA
jgi:hypothetical protein